jgi:biotin--protein ligase
VILIYNDEGASAVCVNALVDFLSEKNNVACVSGNQLQQDDWIKQTKTLIMPGGRSMPFYEKLSSAGNKNIRQFVEQGGTYIGICAGAYYACTETIFAKGLPLELILPGELHFFSGRAIGPVFADEDFAYHSEKGARVVAVCWKNGEIFSSYFNGGCYFEPTDDGVEILSHYIHNNLPAVIRCKVGQGQAILSGIHPELAYHDIPNNDDSYHQTLRKALREIENRRRQLLSHLVDIK